MEEKNLVSFKELEKSGLLQKGLDLESRQMVLDTVRKLKNTLLTKEKILEFDKKEIFPEEIIKEMLGSEIGLQLVFIPEEYGGMGGGARDCCAVTYEMAQICLGIATAFFAIQLGIEPLLVGGTQEQKEKWLGKVANGNTLVAYAVTEANAGSNVANIETKSEPVFNNLGDKQELIGYKINGSKQFISNGGCADFITLLAKTPEGPSFFVVEKNTLGFSCLRNEEKHGIRASMTSSLAFKDVFVPIDNLIGCQTGIGLKQANVVFGYTRLMVASMALGTAKKALNIAVLYAKDRVQFGSSLSEKQGYTHKLIIPNFVKFCAAKAYIDELALRLDYENTSDLQVEGSIAKLFATEMANKTADDCIQALGGYGYITEFEVEKLKRDVKITCIYEGTSEIQQSIISLFRWKLTRKTKGAYYKNISQELLSLYKDTNDIEYYLYSILCEILNEIISYISEKGLSKKQYIMFLMADMMAYLEVGVSLSRKALKSLDFNNLNKNISKVFANEVGQIFLQNLFKILDKQDFVDFSKSLKYQDLISSILDLKIIDNMDKISNFLFSKEGLNIYVY